MKDGLNDLIPWLEKLLEDSAKVDPDDDRKEVRRQLFVILVITTTRRRHFRTSHKAWTEPNNLWLAFDKHVLRRPESMQDTP